MGDDDEVQCANDTVPTKDPVTTANLAYEPEFKKFVYVCVRVRVHVHVHVRVRVRVRVRVHGTCLVF